MPEGLNSATVPAFMSNTPEIPTPTVIESATAPTFEFGGYALPTNRLIGEGFGRRALARIIDLVMHYVIAIGAGVFVGIILVFVAAATHQPFVTITAKLSGFHPVTTLAAIAGSCLYEIICEGLHGSTLGKLVLGMVVVDESGKPCGMKAAVIRSAAYFVDGLFFGIVGYSAMKRDETRQRYGDDWAKTIVTKRSAVAPENLRGTGTFTGALLLAAAADGLLIATGSLIVALG